MKPIWAEYAAPKDAPQANAWLEQTKQNLLDTKAMDYPCTVILRATDGEKNFVFLPTQQCTVLESLGISPSATALEVAASLKALVNVVRFKALENGQGEILFMCTEPSTQKFAEHNGFERVNIPLFRLRIRQ